MVYRSLVIACLFFSQVAASRVFTRITLEDANCGDGKPYSFFISQGSSEKVAFEFMGGGACWDANSCFGPGVRTWAHPIPKLPAYSTLSHQSSFFADWTYVYFPYCTGDVFAGRHTSYYPLLKKAEGKLHVQVHHHGAWNIEKALEHLLFFQQNHIKWQALERLAVMGASAGAIGSLIHAPLFERQLHAQKKYLLLDSPGMHWPNSFWQRFDHWMMWDFAESLEPIGLPRDLAEQSPLAQFSGTICQSLPSWKVGFMQAARDIVMARLFGEISLSQHAELFYGPKGLVQTMKKAPKNCHAWANNGPWHTYFIAPPTLEVSGQVLGTSSLDPLINPIKAKDFLKDFFQN
jgi:hypothetical protein